MTEPTWRTSSRTHITDCVEVAPPAGDASRWRVRDTKNRAGGVLALPAAAFARLTGFARRS